MKAKLFFISLGLSVALIATAVVGVFAQLHIARQQAAAYESPTLSKYLGHSVAISEANCNLASSRIANAIADPSKLLSTETATYAKVAKSGSTSSQTYKWFADSKIFKSIKMDPILDSESSIKTSIESRLRLKVLQDEAVAQVSSPIFQDQISSLRASSQLPAGVNTSGWESAFVSEFLQACKSTVDQAIGKTAKQNVHNIAILASGAAAALQKDWAGPDFDKVSFFGAYKAQSGGSCPTYNPCATFYLKTAVVCTIQVVVEFQDSSHNPEATSKKTIKIQRALTPQLITVEENSVYSNGGYYNVKDAKCM